MFERKLSFTNSSGYFNIGIGSPNHNKRIYPKSLFINLIGAVMYGKLGQVFDFKPLTPEEADVKTIIVDVTDEILTIEYELFNKSIFKSDIDDGVLVFSQRGIGKIDAFGIVENYELIGFDLIVRDW